MATFDEHLARVAGTHPIVDRGNPFERRQKVSNYHWNNAENLHAGALLAWHGTMPGFPVRPTDIGLHDSFSLEAALHPVFRLLAGLSLEMLLKAIARVLDLPDSHIHDLRKLCEKIGVEMSPEHWVVLDNLTHAIVWSARYPVPRRQEEWDAAHRADLATRDQRPLGPLKVYEYNPDKAVNLRTYQAIWDKLADCYWRAKEASASARSRAIRACAASCHASRCWAWDSNIQKNW